MSKQVLGIACLVIAALVGMAFYSTNVFTERNRFVPAKIFEAAFDEPVARAEELQGVKDDSTQYDVRLKFKYPHEPKPFHEDEYKTALCYEARNWFNEKYPGEKSLQEMDFLKFKQRRKNETTMVTNEWILYNPHTDYVYYRIFGTSR